MPTNEALQVFYRSIPLIAAILLAIWLNNKRLDEMSKRIDDLSHRIDNLGHRIDDLRAYVDGQITGLREFIRSEIRRVEERIERLEHPLVRG